MNRPLLFATIAVLARNGFSQPGLPPDWEKEKIYRPPVIRRFNPAPGYSAILSQWRSISDPNRLQIFKGTECVYTLESRGMRMFIGEKSRSFNPKAQDVSGDGVPDLIVVDELGEWSAKTRILSLGKKCKQLVQLDSVFVPRFSRDHQGRLLAEIRDQTYSCWGYDHASSPYPRIVLRLQANRFVLAPELMRSPPVKSKINLSEIKAVDWKTGGRLTALMVDNLYAGHPEECCSILRRTSLSEKQQRHYMRALKARVRTSPWAAQLATQL